MSQQAEDALSSSTIQQIVAAGTDVKQMDNEAISALGVAVEGFMSALVKKAAESMAANRRDEVLYKDVANTVEETACLDFLEDIVPQQMSAAQYLQNAREQRQQQ